MTNTQPPTGTAARLQAQRPRLTDEQSRQIFLAACELISAALQRRSEKIADPTFAGAADRTVMGAFVTLKRQGKLRACCGALGRPMPLAEALRQSALRTALDDNRLPPISVTELPFLDVDVQLLYGFQPLSQTGTERVQAVETGRHGLQIRRGNNAGLLLPAVATEQGYNSEEFLRQVCRKAGLPTTAWEDPETELQTFEACEIPGRFAEETIVLNAAPTSPISSEDLQTLSRHASANLAALVQGATPGYYVPGVSDGTVQGIALSLKPRVGDPFHFFKLSMRPGVPLQATLFQLVETTANALRAGQLPIQGTVSIALTIYFDSAMHGTVAEPDLRGVDPTRRALMIMEGNKSAIVFDVGKSAEELLTIAKQQVNLFHSTQASVFSFATLSTEQAVTVGNAPRPAAGPANRQPAVAGSFYPGAAAELNRMVDEYLGDPVTKRAVPAVMVPHAGLIYSGRLAAQVLKQVEIPDTVIILGPKHTRHGVEWAIAPHDKWVIPGGEIENDRELAQELVAAIPGLQLDAAAHFQEHAIEVELPFLHRLAPRAKVVGIVLGMGDLDRCRQFATGLAKVLKAKSRRPLLVISSDMNHYASDDENRRLDEIAMQALERLDPTDLYETITGRNISMCGVLPAVIVLETLRQLDGVRHAQRLGYATSAEVSGDKSRVVGYCGMSFST